MSIGNVNAIMVINMYSVSTMDSEHPGLWIQVCITQWCRSLQSLDTL